MTDDVSDLVLEGNSAVTLLQELFACDITAQCEACGSIQGVGSLRRHGAPMGAHTPHGRWLEMKGARYLRFQSSM